MVIIIMYIHASVAIHVVKDMLFAKCQGSLTMIHRGRQEDQKKVDKNKKCVSGAMLLRAMYTIHPAHAANSSEGYTFVNPRYVQSYLS